MSEQETVNQLFLEEADDLLADMESVLLELEEDPDNTGLVNQVFRTIHTLKGAADMFGYSAVVVLAHEVESVFDLVREGTLSVDAAVLEVGLAAKDVIRAMLEQADLEGEGEVYKALLGELRSFQGQEPQEAPVLPEQSSQDASVQDEGEDGKHTYDIRFRVSDPGALVHMDPLTVLQELRELGEATVQPDLEQFPELASLDPETCAMEWNIRLVTDKDENAVRDVFIFIEDSGEITLEKVAGPENPPLEKREPEPESGQGRSDPVQPVRETAPDLEPPPAFSGEESLDAPETRTVAGYKANSGGSVKVEAYKLDDMVSLVGELVIAQTRLSQVASRTENAELHNVAEDIELLSGVLRERTMSMRMLPISTMFDSFRRLVRDMSKELGKEIRLVTEGGETEMDKTLIERMGDPLLHLMRNCIDHGLETPDVREAAGKPRQGVVKLSAEHTGGHVFIRIQDDGKGFDKDSIVARAKERGLLRDESELTDKEILALVLEPGFSTADSVNSISGRGVGMDVVKRQIDDLRGQVDMDSTPGKGSAITIKLPLTLAIIEGLQVRVGRDFFVIPLSMVEECVELAEGEQPGANNGSAKRILNLRDEIVPYVSLREWFAVGGESPAIQQIIIANDGRSRTGIVVDEVIGQQQTVIKSLGKVFEAVREISGATVKGDGTMALILDVPQLIGRVRGEGAGD